VDRLAQALRQEMERRGHSYRDAARAMGVSSGSVVNWSKGWIEDNPRRRNLEALADYLGVAFYHVLGLVGFLTDDEVAALSTIPGSLRYVDFIALTMAQGRLNLNWEPAEVLAAS
jgi:transcriptional regulator with XRE-family HTH domain